VLVLAFDVTDVFHLSPRNYPPSSGYVKNHGIFNLSALLRGGIYCFPALKFSPQTPGRRTPFGGISGLNLIPRSMLRGSSLSHRDHASTFFQHFSLRTTPAGRISHVPPAPLRVTSTIAVERSGYSLACPASTSQNAPVQKNLSTVCTIYGGFMIIRLPSASSHPSGMAPGGVALIIYIGHFHANMSLNRAGVSLCPCSLFLLCMTQLPCRKIQQSPIIAAVPVFLRRRRNSTRDSIRCHTGFRMYPGKNFRDGIFSPISCVVLISYTAIDTREVLA